MKVSQLTRGAYQCYGCDDDFEGSPTIEYVIHGGLLSGMPTWDEAEENGWVWERITCEGDCTQYNAMDEGGESYSQYSDPWKCGKCGSVWEGLALAIKCCS